MAKKKQTAKKRPAKKRSVGSQINRAEKLLARKRGPEIQVKPNDLVSSGAFVLDLACSETPHGAFGKGHFYYLVGDSSSGKTFISRTVFSEAVQNKYFKNYRLIFDDIEKGSLMDNEFFFGRKAAEKIEAPAYYDDGEPCHSEIIEDLYFNLADAIERGEPFIYVADSMDALSSKAEQKKFKERRNARRSGKEIKGEMSDGKAKVNSSNLRGIINGLKETGSILILIGQTRDALNTFNPFGPKKTRSGGRSLTFYATLELWLSVAGRETKTVNGRKRKIGTLSRIQIKKNRISGNDRTVVVPIINSYGIDDILASVRFLLDEKHWSKNKSGQINAEEFGFKGVEEKLIAHIEENEFEPDLRMIVNKVWNDVERKIKVPRKGRYE